MLDSQRVYVATNEKVVWAKCVTIDCHNIKIWDQDWKHVSFAAFRMWLFWVIIIFNVLYIQ